MWVSMVSIEMRTRLMTYYTELESLRLDRTRIVIIGRSRNSELLLVATFIDFHFIFFCSWIAVEERYLRVL